MQRALNDFVEHLNLEQELGYCSLDVLLDAVASGKVWPVTATHPPETRQQLLAPLGKQQLMPHQQRVCQHQRGMLRLFQWPLWH